MGTSARGFPPSPLRLSALAVLAGLFLAWERGYLLLLLGSCFFLLRRKWPFLLLFLGAAIWGLLIFEPPKAPSNLRLKKTVSACLRAPLLERDHYQRGIVDLSGGKKALFYFPKDLSLSPGTCFRARVSLKETRSFLNPFAPDFARLRRAQGISWVGRVKEVLETWPGSASPLARARAYLFSFARGLSPKARGLFEALVLGEKSHLPPSFKEAFSRLGLFHFLAVSGLHLALLLGLISLVLKGIFFLWPRPLESLPFKQWLVLSAAPFLLAYALLSGPSPSALRALVMFFSWAVALLLFRETKGLDLLALAILLILIFQPQAVGSLSFRLSVSAVLAILLFEERFGAFFAGQRGLKRFLLEGLGVSLAATLATAPWLFSFKGTVSPWAPVSNLLALPAFAFLILPIELLVAALAPFFREKALWLAEGAARALVLPGLTPPVLSAPYPLGAFLFTLSLPVVLGLLGKRRGLLAGLLLALASGALFLKAYAGLRLLTVLDVGEGSAALAKVGAREALLFDVGPRRGDFDAGEMILLPALNKLALRPQAAIISHFQSDHAGGLEAIKRAWPGLRVIGPEGREKELSGPGFRVLFFRDPSFKTKNEASLVSLLEMEGVRVLFPGDIGRRRELSLLEAPIKAEVLILPHHGARTSASYPFLKRVSPRLSLSSARAAYHPAKETLKRLEALGIPHLSTKDYGAISLIFEKGKTFVCLETERRKYPLLLRSLWPFLKVGCRPLSPRGKGPYLGESP